MAVNTRSQQVPHIKLPNFEPLPPDRWMNRVINNMLKPIFYLLFTLITSIVVIPIFTIFENLKSRNRAQRGERTGNRGGYTVNGRPVENHSGSLQQFLKGYGNSYGHTGARVRAGSH